MLIPKGLYFDRLALRIAETSRDYGAAVRMGVLDREDPRVRREWEVFIRGGAFALRSKLVLMPVEQGVVFLEQPALEGQDYLRWLRLPFQNVFLEFVDGTLVFGEYVGEFVRSPTPKAVRALSLYEYQRGDRFAPGSGGSPDMVRDIEACQRAWRACFWFDLVGAAAESIECHAVTFGVSERNELVHAWQYPDVAAGLEERGETRAVNDRARTFAVHAINFLSSPSVTLQPVEDRGTPGRKSAMLAVGLEPPKGPVLPHVVAYLKAHRASSVASPEGPRWHHRYQYDVRGHFKVGHRGRWLGRVVWCPPHRRGLANPIYRPSAYRTQKAIQR